MEIDFLPGVGMGWFEVGRRPTWSWWRYTRRIKNEVNAIAVSPDGAWLASACDDGRIGLWSLSGSGHRLLVGHPSWVSDLAWLGEEALVSSSADSTLGIWTSNGHAMRPLYGHVHPVRCVTTCRHSGMIASGDEGGSIRLWDAESGETIEVLQGHGEPVLV